MARAAWAALFVYLSSSNYDSPRLFVLLRSTGVQPYGVSAFRREFRKWQATAMIEAVASGTPVIAFNRGSVPEVIEVGLTRRDKRDRRRLRIAALVT